jgi:hypothetical protein
MYGCLLAVWLCCVAMAVWLYGCVADGLDVLCTCGRMCVVYWRRIFIYSFIFHSVFEGAVVLDVPQRPATRSAGSGNVFPPALTKPT